MKLNKQVIVNFLKESPENLSMFEQIILGKDDAIREIEAEKEAFLASDPFPELNSESKPYFLTKVCEMLYDDYRDREMKDLKNLTFFYNQTRKHPRNRRTDWEEKYENATERVRIEDVVRHFVRADSLKRNIRCPLPHHQRDKTPSFKVYENTNTFYCFGCNEKGSPIDFVMKMKGLTFNEAVEFLSMF